MTDLKALTSRLADITRRLARFEPVGDDELAEFAAQRDAVLASLSGKDTDQ